jgi:two-component system, chemotaxis family, chemotaxis protein CheY
MVLSDLGIEFVEAEDGQQALDVLESDGAIDVAFVDWSMPTMDGMEFLRRVRATSRWDSVQILMVTVNTEMANVSEALEAGANEYVMKPFDKEIVTSKLQLLGCQHESESH